MAALIAGLPIEVGGVTVNRLCGSSLQAINQAAQSIAADCEDVQIAGGVEHMQHIPMEAGFDASPRLLLPPQPGHDEHGPDRREPGHALQDQPAASRTSSPCAAISARPRPPTRARLPARSFPPGAATRRAAARSLTEDQCIRRDTSLEALAALKPAFMPEGGTVTAGNSSPLNVGAAALLIMSEEQAQGAGSEAARCSIRAMAVAGVDPSVMGIGPVPATHKALERAGLKLADIDLIELNEAFAAQSLAVIKLLKADPEKVNVRGGAIAIGHPLGASGARIATTLIHAMIDRKAQVRPGDHVHRRGPGHRDDLRKRVVRGSAGTGRPQDAGRGGRVAEQKAVDDAPREIRGSGLAAKSYHRAMPPSSSKTARSRSAKWNSPASSPSANRASKCASVSRRVSVQGLSWSGLPITSECWIRSKRCGCSSK